MQRRDFLKNTGLTTGAIVTTGLPVSAATENSPSIYQYQLKYAPHIGMFKHHAGEDPVEIKDLLLLKIMV